METKQKLSGYYHLYTVYVCVISCVVCILVYIPRAVWVPHRSIRMCGLPLSAVCNMLLGVSVVRYVTVSNIDKLAQKLC